jgi:hypothetical protein
MPLMVPLDWLYDFSPLPGWRFNHSDGRLETGVCVDWEGGVDLSTSETDEMLLEPDRATAAGCREDLSYLDTALKILSCEGNCVRLDEPERKEACLGVDAGLQLFEEVA